MRNRLVLVRELQAIERERAHEWRPNRATCLDAEMLRLRSELAALDAVASGA